MSLNLVHPGRRKLVAWLEGHEADPKTDRHLGTCAHCADRLEELAPPAADLRVELARALQAPTDLVPRLQSGVRKRLEGRQDLLLLGQMLGLDRKSVV